MQLFEPAGALCAADGEEETGDAAMDALLGIGAGAEVSSDLEAPTAGNPLLWPQIQNIIQKTVLSFSVACLDHL